MGPAVLDLQDFVGIEEQQDLWMIVALKLEVRKGTYEEGCHAGHWEKKQEWKQPMA